MNTATNNKPAATTDDAEQITKSRHKAMFFEKVGSGKEIPFERTLVLCKQINGKDYFTTGVLTAQIKTSEGYRYEFLDDQQAGEAHPETFDFWLLPVVS
jgi:homoserine acetyltransferase